MKTFNPNSLGLARIDPNYFLHYQVIKPCHVIPCHTSQKCYHCKTVQQYNKVANPFVAAYEAQPHQPQGGVANTTEL